MERVKTSNIYLNMFEAIKCDDLVTFSSLIENDKMLSTSFGRFPILTLCYMYDSKKIVSMYENRLIKIGNYTRVFEPFEVYERFIKLCKKSLRLYMLDDAIVYPLEMLVFTKRYDYLTKIYDISYKNEQIIKNIEYISKHITREKIEIDRLSITIKNPRLKPHQKGVLIASVMTSAIMLVMCLLIAILQPMIIGSGSIEKPFMVYSEKQLITAMKSGGNYRLGKDITLTSPWARLSEFAGTLDGDNHKIIASDYIIDEFVYNLKGTIKNVRFDFGEGDYEVKDSKAFVVALNNSTGVIDNVDVIIKRDFSTKDNLSNQSSYLVSTLCLENYGTIKNCDMTIDYDYDSQGEVDVYLLGMLGINRGTGVVENCTTTGDSNITATQVDIAGVIGFNYTEYNLIGVYAVGVLYNITNNADITVSSTSSGWSPVVGGVCIENRGEASGLRNTGSIVVSEASQSTDRINISVAGIVVTNYYKVSDSCNTGSIVATSKVAAIRIGGVVATATRLNYQTYQTPYTYSIITSCYSVGEYTATTISDTANISIGGIVAYALHTDIKECYSININVSSVDRVYVGAICGLVNDAITTTSNYGVIKDNAYLGDTYGVGGVYSVEGEVTDVYLVNVDGDFATKKDSLDEIKNMDIYWE